MSDKLDISITQQDMDTARVTLNVPDYVDRSRNCPLALAIDRRLNISDAAVGTRVGRSQSAHMRFIFPVSLSRWVFKFDHDRPVEPEDFTILTETLYERGMEPDTAKKRTGQRKKKKTYDERPPDEF